MSAESIKTVAPILITRTRSFWFGILPAVLTGIDVLARSVTDGTSEPIAGAIALVLSPITGLTAEDVHSFMVAIAPIFALIVAQQRGGLSRPYTT
nr:hypothetical protein [Paracoccus saliphilus]